MPSCRFTIHTSGLCVGTHLKITHGGCLIHRGGSQGSWWYGIFTGLAYIYMVAAWGGYVFVLNMIGFHAVALVFLGRHSTKLHRAYSLFYIIGTAGAIQV